MNSKLLKKQVPIIALTAYNDEREQCLSVGMKRFRKPDDLCETYVAGRILDYRYGEVG